MRTKLWFCTECLAPAWLGRHWRNQHMREVHHMNGPTGQGFRAHMRLFNQNGLDSEIEQSDESTSNPTEGARSR